MFLYLLQNYEHNISLNGFIRPPNTLEKDMVYLIAPMEDIV